MKKFFCYVLTFIFTAICCVSCTGIFPFDSESGSNRTQVPPSGDASSSDGENTSSGSTDTSSKDSDSDPEPDPDPDPEPELYSPVLSEQLPMISINTLDGAEITGDRLNSDYFAGTVSVSNCEEEYVFTDVSADVKVRGNYTANYPKKPYRIKFNKKRNMLGLNGNASCKSWVLLADYKDPSMLRNATANYLGQLMIRADGYYATDFRPVEVTVNGTYRGVYLLVEQQQVNKNRFDITEPETDYTGTDIGYLLEFDWYYKESPALENFAMNYYRSKLTTKLGESKPISQSGYTIKSDVYSAQQRDYIKKYMDNLFEIAYKAVYEHTYYQFDADYNVVPADSLTSAKEVVEQIIDVRSLVNMYIFHEICCDRDVASSSFYMTVDLGSGGSGKLTFQSPWDWDSSLGIMPDPDVNAPFACAENWRGQVNPWLVLFVNEGWFWDMVTERWQELSALDLKTRLTSMIDSYTELYADNYAKNFKKWTACMGKKVDSNVRDELLTFKTQADASAQLSSWLVDRLTFLDSFFARGDI